MIPRRWVAAVVFGLSFLPVSAQGGGRVVIPRAWQNKLQNSPWDTNHNQVDDALEALGPGSTVELIVDLNACLDAAARTRLSAFGTIDYEAVNFPILYMTDVPFAQLIPLARDPIVAFLEHDEELHHTLDVSNPALQVKPGYPTPSPPPPLPITVHEKYPGILGASAGVAIVDLGIDDVWGPNTVHQSLQGFNGGMRCPAPLNLPCVDTNPDDTTGSGTHVAGIVLGAGEGGVDAPHQGLAPLGGLYDVQVPLQRTGPGGMGLILASRLIRTLDAIANRVWAGQWQLQTILVPWIGCTASNGTDALSQAVNQLGSFTVITGIGNCSACMAPDGPCTSCPCSLVAAPAAADHAIAVGFSDDNGTVTRDDDTLSIDSLRGPRSSDGDEDMTDELKPDFVAPGVNISSAHWVTVDQYVNRSGSSAAAAHAAGCSALVWDIANKRAFDVKRIFIDTAEDHGGGAWDPGWGAGILNCFAAVDYVNNFACASLRFSGACGGFGQPPCGLHPGVHAEHWPVEGVLNTVIADVVNDGPGFTLPYTLKMRVDSFSNGDNASEICSVEMPPLAPGDSARRSCNWTPALSGSAPGVVHACLYADIVYPTDCNDADNHAQHNEEIQQAFSPATAAMFVENPSNEAVMIALVGNFDCGGFSCHGWSFAPSDNFFSLMPDDCPVEVVLEASPITTDAVRRAQVHVKTYGQNQFGGVSDLGSVTLTAHLACPPRNLTWAPMSKSLLTWLPPDGWDACVDTTFDVARGVLPIRRYPSTTRRGDYTAAICLADEQWANNISDSTVPPSGTGFYYLVRSGGPAPGSWDLVDPGQRGRADDTLHTCTAPEP